MKSVTMTAAGYKTYT